MPSVTAHARRTPMKFERNPVGPTFYRAVGLPMQVDYYSKRRPEDDIDWSEPDKAIAQLEKAMKDLE